MTLLNPTTGRPVAVAPIRVPCAGALRATGGVLAAMLRRYREARAIERLMELDATRLKDLGLSRGEIETAVRRGRNGLRAG